MNQKTASGFRIVMVPVPIGSLSAREVNSPYYHQHIRETRCWVVENVRTMRRFLASLKLGIDIDSLVFFELHRDFSRKALYEFLETHIASGNVGVASEAGLPGMADPGGLIALWAHENGVAVEPLVGAGSLMLALIASGLNGQQFTCHGYAPIKEPELKSFLQQTGKMAMQTGYTQIFIEAPYRSDRFMAQLCTHLPPGLFLCVARSLHEPDCSIVTKTVADWRSAVPNLGKAPCIFLIGSDIRHLSS